MQIRPASDAKDGAFFTGIATAILAWTSEPVAAGVVSDLAQEILDASFGIATGHLDGPRPNRTLSEREVAFFAGLATVIAEHLADGEPSRQVRFAIMSAIFWACQRRRLIANPKKAAAPEPSRN